MAGVAGVVKYPQRIDCHLRTMFKTFNVSLLSRCGASKTLHSQYELILPYEQR
jgi:hypothetical protein